MNTTVETVKEAILNVFADGKPHNFYEVREATGIHFQALEIVLSNLSQSELEMGWLDGDGEFQTEEGDYLVSRAWRLGSAPLTDH